MNNISQWICSIPQSRQRLDAYLHQVRHVHYANQSRGRHVPQDTQLEDSQREGSPEVRSRALKDTLAVGTLHALEDILPAAHAVLHAAALLQTDVLGLAQHCRALFPHSAHPNAEHHQKTDSPPTRTTRTQKTCKST
jgi:hypothetical protein